MTPEEIEYIREWAAGKDKFRYANEVEDTISDVLWQMLDRDEDTFCELSPLGLTIAAQAERIRVLEADHNILRDHERIRELEKLCALWQDNHDGLVVSYEAALLRLKDARSRLSAKGLALHLGFELPSEVQQEINFYNNTGIDQE
jgi:hypothetical protein